MSSSSRQDLPINSNYMPQLSAPRSGTSTGSTSPIEPLSSSASLRSFLPAPSAAGSLGNAAAGVRMGANSPSNDFSGRLLSKRTREIQAMEGLSPQVWGPPTSGHSTPLRETIPESPNGESFPDFNSPVPDSLSASQPRRARTRAGTLPSTFGTAPALGGFGGFPSSSLIPKTARPTPSTSPFPGQNGQSSLERNGISASSNAAVSQTEMLNRLRAGSMPQRPGFSPQTPSAFGSSLYTSGWNSNRGRSSTLASIQSLPSNGPDSPAQSLGREPLESSGHQTLEWLGLDKPSPQLPRATLQPSQIELLLDAGRTPNQATNSRFRSFSVNNKDAYPDDPLDPYASLLNEEVIRHNDEVKKFALYQQSVLARPRANTTAGDLPSHVTRGFRMPPPSRLGMDNALPQVDLAVDNHRLSEAMEGLNVRGGGLTHNTYEDDDTAQGPTRALWLGNIPNSTTTSTLEGYFERYGEIESSRVLTHKNCGFVNFKQVDSAIQAKESLNGKDIFPGHGPVRINYAKAPSATATPGHNGIFPPSTPDPNARAQADSKAAAVNGQANGLGNDSKAPLPKTPELQDIRPEIIAIVKELGATPEEQGNIAERVDLALLYNQYSDELPSLPEPSHNRTFDAPKLREIRKRLENSQLSPEDIESYATQMLPEISELSWDYLGNTVVQRLFEKCTLTTKESILRKIGPDFAAIGVHKNGTWAAQKMIEVAKSFPKLQQIIVDAIRPYTIGLFYDQYGNYVVQGCLKFKGQNNFVFDAILNRLWDLAQGRFSARAVRACLESHDATKDQQRMIAASIALHSVQLATNANGALLLTWFLDTCNFPNRRTVLTPRLIPHLVHLCTHKVAFLTVLKIINQKLEPEARTKIVDALFFSPDDQVLEDILAGDVANGGNFVFKALTTPNWDEDRRAKVHERVRTVLLRINATPAQGYKRLMEEVGLPARGSFTGNRGDSSTRPGSARDSPANAHIDPARHMYPNMVPAGYDMQRNGSMDSNGFDQYGHMAMHPPMYAVPGVQPVQQGPPGQLNQVMYQASNFVPRNGGYYHPAAYQVPSVSVEGYAVPQPGYSNSPLMQPANLNMVPAANMVPAGVPAGVYGAPYGMYVPQQQQQQQQQQQGRGAGGPRGRRGQR